MEFCPKCSSILVPQKNSEGTRLVCRRCGYTRPLSPEDENAYRITQKITHGPEEETVIIDEKLAQWQTMPTTVQECPKCHHKRAYYWQVQTRSGDEGMTTFYRCCKCGQTWREY